MAMDLIIWRHAEAVDSAAGGDLARKLTAKGEKQAERMAKWLETRLPRGTRMLVSPALRCQQTAAALGRDFETVDAIAPAAPAQAVLDAAGWPDASAPVLVVGHQPTLGLAASLALTGQAQIWSIKKAGVWWLRHRERVDDEESKVIVVAVESPDSI